MSCQYGLFYWNKPWSKSNSITNICILTQQKIEISGREHFLIIHSCKRNFGKIVFLNPFLLPSGSYLSVRVLCGSNGREKMVILEGCPSLITIFTQTCVLVLSALLIITKLWIPDNAVIYFSAKYTQNFKLPPEFAVTLHLYHQHDIW